MIYQIEVRERSRRRAPDRRAVLVSSYEPWRRFRGYPAADLPIQEARASILRAVWPLRQFRVVLPLED